MFKLYAQLKGKQKLMVVVSGLLLLTIVAYQFSIRNTIAQYSQYKSQKAFAAQAENAPLAINHYEKQLKELENTVAKKAYSRPVLFETVNTKCDQLGLSLADFGDEQLTNYEGLNIITNPIEVRGGYKDILQLAYHLEQEMQITHIASIHFEKKRDLRSKKTFLSAALQLQNITTKSEEDE